jgi:hypothetical protein
VAAASRSSVTASRDWTSASRNAAAATAVALTAGQCGVPR